LPASITASAWRKWALFGLATYTASTSAEASRPGRSALEDAAPISAANAAARAASREYADASVMPSTNAASEAN